MNQSEVPRVGMHIDNSKTSNALPLILSFLKYSKEELKKPFRLSKIQKNELHFDFSDLPLTMKKTIITEGIIQGGIFEYSDCFACLKEFSTSQSESSKKNPLSIYLRASNRQALILGITIIEELIAEVNSKRKSRFSSTSEDNKIWYTEKKAAKRSWPHVCQREYEIKDLPKTAIGRVIMKGIVNGAINQYSGSVVSTRGSPFILGDKSEIPPDERPLYLVIEGPSNQSLKLAVQAIENLITDISIPEKTSVPKKIIQNNNSNSLKPQANSKILPETTTAAGSIQQPKSSSQPTEEITLSSVIEQLQQFIKSSNEASGNCDENHQSTNFSQKETTTMVPQSNLQQTQTGVPQIMNTVQQMHTGITQVMGNTQPLQTGILHRMGNTQQIQTGIPQVMSNTQPLQTGIPYRMGNTQLQTGIPHKMGNTQQVQTAIPQIIGNTQQLQTGIPHRMGNTQQVQTGIPYRMGNTQQLQTFTPQIIGNTQQLQTGIPYRMGNTQQVQTATPQIIGNIPQMQIGMQQEMVNNTQQLQDNQETSLSTVIEQLQQFIQANKS